MPGRLTYTVELLFMYVILLKRNFLFCNVIVAMQSMSSILMLRRRWKLSDQVLVAFCRLWCRVQENDSKLKLRKLLTDFSSDFIHVNGPS